MRDAILLTIVLAALLLLNGCDPAHDMAACKEMCKPRLVVKYSNDSGCVCEPTKEEPHGR